MARRLFVLLALLTACSTELVSRKASDPAAVSKVDEIVHQLTSEKKPNDDIANTRSAPLAPSADAPSAVPATEEFPGLSITNASCREDMHVCDFLVTLSRISTSPVSFTPVIESTGSGIGHATIGQDVAPSLLGFSLDGGYTFTMRDSLTIPPGQAALWLRTSMHPDSDPEPTENFRLNTTSIFWRSITFPAVTAIGSIVNDDDVPKIGIGSCSGSVGQMLVRESGLKSDPTDTSENFSCSFAFDSKQQGVRSVTIEGVTFSFSQIALLNENPQVIETEKGLLSLIGFAGNNNLGTVALIYTLKAPVINSPGFNSSTDVIRLSLLTEGNVSANDLVTVLIVDDVPIFKDESITEPDTLTVDEIALTVDAAASFGDNFSAAVDYGADGPGSMVYSLALNGTNAASGLFAPGSDTSPGNPIILSQQDDTITGSAGGRNYFTIRINPDSGELTLDQVAEIYHPDSEQITKLKAAPGAFLLIATARDRDSDEGTISVDVGVRDVFGFKDDAPLSVSEITINEGSPFANFVIRGNKNQKVRLSLSDQNDDGTDLSVIEVLQNSHWTAYAEGNIVPLDSSGNLLARVDVSPEQDDFVDSPELFSLAAENLFGRKFKGGCSILDNGAGGYFASNNITSIPLTPPGVVLDNDTPVLKLFIKTQSDSGVMGDKVTADVFPELILSGPSNGSGLIQVLGAFNDPINPPIYVVNETRRADKRGLSYYSIRFVDSDPMKAGVQSIGRFFLGEVTNNGVNKSDGEYAVVFNDMPVDKFTIQTVKGPRGCLQNIFGNKIFIPKNVTDAFINTVDTSFFGYRRRPNKNSTSSDDNVLGEITKSDVLVGKGGSDLLNGVGDRLSGELFNPASNEPAILSQVDSLTGGKGADFFQLGDVAGTFYDRSKSNDYAFVTDFERGDKLVLQGSKEMYRMRLQSIKGRPVRLLLFFGNIESGELIAQIQGSAISALAKEKNPQSAIERLLAEQVYL